MIYEQKDFSDIIETPWPRSTSRGRMYLTQRAKIFLPFAALTGYEEELEKKRFNGEEMVSLEEDAVNQINEAINLIYAELEKGNKPLVEINFYLYSEKNKGGVYTTKKGRIQKIDLQEHWLLLEEEKISFRLLHEIKII